MPGAAVAVSMRLLGTIADGIAGLQQEAFVADHELDFSLQDVGDFLAFMRDEAAAAARSDVVDAALKQVRLVIRDQPFERQPRAVALWGRMHEGAFARAR